MKRTSRPPPRLIALLTDFGHRDPYVGIMKGVILSRAPAARITDLCHGISAQDVRQGAFALMSAVDYFPAGTLFVCVVDPGVGSRRAVLWARGRRHEFLAPDNGLLSWVAEREPLREVRRLAEPALFLPEVSGTFHGRDIFAPVAAALVGGVRRERLGPRRGRMRRLPFPRPRRRGRSLQGEVLAVDGFGNAVTNLVPGGLRRGAAIECRGEKLGPLKASYASVRPGRALALAGSHGYVELSVREGSFAERFDVRVGEPVHAR